MENFFEIVISGNNYSKIAKGDKWTLYGQKMNFVDLRSETSLLKLTKLILA